MSFLSKYKTDKDAEKNGTWIDIDEGVSWKIARLNNDKAVALRAKLEAPYKTFREVPKDKQEGIFRKVVAQTVWLDWKGMTDEDGKAIEYSAAKAEELLTEYPDLLNDVVGLAATRETFQADATEASKNA